MPSQTGLQTTLQTALDTLLNEANEATTKTVVTTADEAEDFTCNEIALMKKLNASETENKQLKKVSNDVKALILSLKTETSSLEGGKPAGKSATATANKEKGDTSSGPQCLYQNSQTWSYNREGKEQ